MRKTLRWALCLALTAAAAGVYGCGSGGSGDTAGVPGSGTGVAALSGTLESGTLAKRVGGDALGPVDVAAVDETGLKVDEALAVTGSFSLELPWEHDYVLIFADARGIVGAMVYGVDEQAAFGIPSGTLTLDLGGITIDPRHRRVKVRDGANLQPAAGVAVPDADADGIPDTFDDDVDNDGIPNDVDTGVAGEDLSRDHDNDGVATTADADDDDDGIADDQDPELNDTDNDGVDDDRDAGMGDSSLGALLWTDHCSGCHGDGIDDASVRTLADVLENGLGTNSTRMPAFPELVSNAPDLAAYLMGRTGEDDAPGDGTGDVTVGGRIWNDTCAGCHGEGLEEVEVDEIAEALDEGKDDEMPAFPELVANAGDIAAYLNDSENGGAPPPPPADTDGDGVPDSADRCPDVAGAGADGCPVVLPPVPPADADGDGVPDRADQCPGTPAGIAVDAQGCPVDSDGDGVPDYQDPCPDVAGTGADGCPVGPARPAVLDTTCLNCHGDNSALVGCANGTWIAHDGSRVSSAVYDEVSIWATGDVCAPPTPTRPAALDTTCLNCHGDNSALVDCANGKWIAHNGGRVPSAVYDPVSIWATGGTCP